MTSYALGTAVVSPTLVCILTQCTLVGTQIGAGLGSGLTQSPSSFVLNWSRPHQN